MIAHDPLHRSGRATLPHPAPTLGDDAKTHERIRMADASRRKPANQESLGLVPMLESDHEVISVAHHDNIAVRLPASPLPDPKRCAYRTCP